MNAPPKAAYQPDEASAKIGAAGFLSVLGLAAAAAAIAFGLYSAFDRGTQLSPASALQRAALAAPSPRLESNPLEDRLALERPARRILASYGWADRGKGLAHIPIERAMALQAQHGWPDAGTPKK